MTRPIDRDVCEGRGSRGAGVNTNIPARMDRLLWSRWHWLVIISLGITWVLDGLEVTIVGAIASILKEPQTLHFSDADVGNAATAYLIGAVVGALFFGRLTDILGRKKLFMITLSLYLISTVLTAFSFNFFWFAIFRALTGAGIGGEYAAVNSAVDELIPARVRGWTDLAINGSWWGGTALGALATVFLVNPHFLPVDLGWRIAFAIGALLGLAILLVRRFVPESPRWLMMHGRFAEADHVISGIEEQIKRDEHVDELPPPEGTITIHPRGVVTYSEIASTVFKRYPTRAILGLALMAGQAFIYNAVFFTYGLVLTTFYHVPASDVGWYLIPFAIGNILGPLTLGRLFDTVGRRAMLSFTYIVSGVLLAITSWLFLQGMLTAVTQTICWVVVFFFASTGASAAYLTVSEIFPLETRAMAIAFFYAVGTLIGGVSAPTLFGHLIGTGKVINVFYGNMIGAGLMTLAGIIAIFFAVDAEGQSLESIARPLSSTEEEGKTGGLATF
jgi:MFS family permease